MLSREFLSAMAAKLPKFYEFLTEAMKIISAAEEKGIPMRLMGALAVAVHCPRALDLYQITGREISDIDVVTYRVHFDGVTRILEGFGYLYDKHIYAVHGLYASRLVFRGPHGLIDVFFDKLEMCHTIDFRERLEIEYPTITVSDLLLEKMQIVRLAQKDIIDTTILLREHDLGKTDNDIINISYIPRLLSKDWGFYYTVTTNLKKLLSFLPTLAFLNENDKKTIDLRIHAILDSIEMEPKSLKWKMRARVGPKVKWYTDVEDLLRGAPQS